MYINNGLTDRTDRTDRDSRMPEEPPYGLVSNLASLKFYFIEASTIVKTREPIILPLLSFLRMQIYLQGLSNFPYDSLPMSYHWPRTYQSMLIHALTTVAMAAPMKFKYKRERFYVDVKIVVERWLTIFGDLPFPFHFLIYIIPMFSMLLYHPRLDSRTTPASK